MSKLKSIKKRVETITSTMKITKTMQMMSSVKIHKINNLISNASTFLTSITESYAKVSDLYNIKNHNDKQKKVFLLCVFASKGLCGGVDFSVKSELKNAIKGINDESKTISFFLLGKKPDNLDIDVKHDCDYIENYEENSIDIASKKITSAFIKSKSDEFCIIYAKPNGSYRYNGVYEKIVPVDESIFKNHKKSRFVLNDDVESIFNKTFKMFLNAEIYNKLLLNFLSENISRVIAMEGATKNGEELNDKLKLMYNKIRQTTITSELIDIVSGAESV